jgi:hypothetical protein
LNLLNIHENAERSGGAGAARESFEIEYVLLRAPGSRYYIESFRCKFGAQPKFVRRCILIGSTRYDQENGRIRKGARRNCQYDNQEQSRNFGESSAQGPIIITFPIAPLGSHATFYGRTILRATPA